MSCGCVGGSPQIHISQPVPGDILIFLTGQEEIETAAEELVKSECWRGPPHSTALDMLKPRSPNTSYRMSHSAGGA